MATSRSVGLNAQNVSEDVKSVQAMLAAWLTSIGSPTIAVDGQCGPTTLAAISAFLTAQGVPPTAHLFYVVSEDAPIALSQGQGEGNTLAEACQKAREACKAQAQCGPQDIVKMEKCSCWKGGNLTYTCIVRCSCSSPVS